MIKLIRRYSLALAVIVPLAAIIIIRNSGTGRFRYDAGRWAEPTFSGSNIITPEKASQLKGDILIVELDREVSVPENIKGRILLIAPDSLFTGKEIKSIYRNNGPVLLNSTDYSVAAKTWMVLSQSGFRNLYILSEDLNNETAKEKFRPDSIVKKPEL